MNIFWNIYGIVITLLFKRSSHFCCYLNVVLAIFLEIFSKNTSRIFFENEPGLVKFRPGAHYNKYIILCTDFKIKRNNH